MEGFEWAQNNLGADTPHQLQSWGVNVYFAPNVPPDQKMVNLADGRVESVRSGQQPAQDGYYADFEGLIHYCRQNGLPFTETDGLVSVLPRGFGEAGSPLRHGES